VCFARDLIPELAGWARSEHSAGSFDSVTGLPGKRRVSNVSKRRVGRPHADPAAVATTGQGHIERLPSGSLRVKVYIGKDRQETVFRGT
jgi:hypothetical protein